MTCDLAGPFEMVAGVLRPAGPRQRRVLGTRERHAGRGKLRDRLICRRGSRDHRRRRCQAGGPDISRSLRSFGAFPHLVADVDFSLLADRQVKSTIAGWIGPAGTVTGYHIDWGDNLLAQVQGRKFLRLVAPADTEVHVPQQSLRSGDDVQQRRRGPLRRRGATRFIATLAFTRSFSSPAT